MAKSKRVSLERLKLVLGGELPEGHQYLLLVVDPKTGETYFSAPLVERTVAVLALEEVLADLKGTRLPVRNIHHKIPVITK